MKPASLILLMCILCISITQNAQAVDVNVKDPKGYYRCDYNEAWKECCSENSGDGYKSLVESFKSYGYSVNVTIDSNACNKIIYVQYSKGSGTEKITYYVGTGAAGCPTCKKSNPTSGGDSKRDDCICDRSNGCDQGQNGNVPFFDPPDEPGRDENCRCDEDCGSSSGSGSGSKPAEEAGNRVYVCSDEYIHLHNGETFSGSKAKIDYCWYAIMTSEGREFAFPVESYLFDIKSDIANGEYSTHECCVPYQQKAGCGVTYCMTYDGGSDEYIPSKKEQTFSEGLSDFFSGECDICNYLSDTKTKLTEIAANTKETATNTKEIATNTKETATNTKETATNTKGIDDKLKDMPKNVATEIYSDANLTKLSDTQYKNLEKFLIEFGCENSTEDEDGGGRKKRDGDCNCDTTTGCDKVDDPTYTSLPPEFRPVPMPQVDCNCDVECDATDGDPERNSICEYLSATKVYQKNMPKNVASALIGEPSTEGNPLEAMEKEMENESKEMEKFYDSECTGTDCSTASESEFEQYKGGLADKIIYDTNGDEARTEIVEKNFGDKLKQAYDDIIKNSPILEYFKGIKIEASGSCAPIKIKIVNYELEIDICQWQDTLATTGNILKFIAVITSLLILIK